MATNPVSVRGGASVPGALALLVGRKMRAAAVIGEAGRPVGVLGTTDLLIRERETAARPLGAGGGSLSAPGRGVRARDLMTPAVFSVRPGTAVSEVVARFLALRVHQLFVVGDSGVLVGVVGALDVLRQLHP